MIGTYNTLYNDMETGNDVSKEMIMSTHAAI